MSHLTILPTVLRDADRLEAVLLARGLAPTRGGDLPSFPPERQPVELQVRLADGLRLERLLGEITRAYAARKALQEAADQLPTAQIELSA